MYFYSRLRNAFEGAPRLPLHYHSKYVLFSDCHRGTGTANDNFLKNKPLYQAALQHYYRCGYSYIELGDGDELWENTDMKQIVEAHSDIFRLFSCFQRQGRLFLLYGNHDTEKKDYCYSGKQLGMDTDCYLPFYEGLILEPMISSACRASDRAIYLTHGHQAELLNSSLWRLARLLVRRLWKPLERYGVLDPTSAAQNHKRKKKTEKRLTHFARQEGHLLITGHTHRPFLSETDLYYCNCGSCVHPFSITCLEIEQLRISLIKWILTPGPDMSLYVTRKVLVGPRSLNILGKCPQGPDR